MRTIEEERDFYKAQAENMQADLKATEAELDEVSERLDMYKQWWTDELAKSAELKEQLDAAKAKNGLSAGAIERLEADLDELRDEYVELHLRERYKSGAADAYENALGRIFGAGEE